MVRCILIAYFCDFIRTKLLNFKFGLFGGGGAHQAIYPFPALSQTLPLASTSNSHFLANPPSEAIVAETAKQPKSKITACVAKSGKLSCREFL